MSEYPKTVTLKDGLKVLMDVKRQENIEQSRIFFTSMPPEDRLYLRRDVTSQKVLEERARELADGRAFRLATYVNDEMIGEANLDRPLYGWTRHVAEMRVVVARQHQGKGVGKALIREIFSNAVRLKYTIVEANVIEEDTKVLDLLERIGFHREGVLRNQAMDFYGKKHNIVVMSFNVDDMWKDLSEYYHSFEIYKT
ncbi:MAG: GNAT family N-acetyltransferase [Acidobacteria bacterium]|nr:GNAT family N-acetyltransferase [Acidobacteriota bacterium]